MEVITITIVSFITSVTSLIMSFVNHVKSSKCNVETPTKEFKLEVHKTPTKNKIVAV